MVVKGPGFSNGIIILQEPAAVYYSGQMISGNVHFELNETVTYSAINMVYLGEATVQRVEKQYEMSAVGENRYRDITYEGREQYFNSMQCVCGGVGKSSLPPGVHSFPFQFQIPFNVPSSFKGEDGIILYCITAYLEYLEPGKREELVKEFQVVAPFNPNTLDSMMQPLQLDVERIETCYCFCNNKPIDLKICLPSGVFHVGCIVPITVKVHNGSSVEIYEINFKITKRHSYRTQRPRSEYTAAEETIAEMTKGPILSDTRREYTWHLPLPAVVLPNLEGCSIMDVTYLFKVKIRMTGCSEDAEDETEIFIGVLPQNDESTEISPDIAIQLPNAPIPSQSLAYGLTVPSQTASVQGSQKFGSQIISNPLESLQNSPYEIGFKSPSNPSIPAYITNNFNKGYPYPPAVNPSYPSGQPSYNLSSSQPNITIVPSAPPL